MNAAFLQAAIPEPFRVLGRDLQPFTLGHQLLLERFGSGFAVGAEEPPSYDDLILSVFLCSFTFEEAIDQLKSKRLWLRLKLWGWRCGNFNVGEAIQMFQAYIAAHTREPDFKVNGDQQGGQSGVPFVQFLKVQLEKELGYTESQALNTPYCTAIWNYLTILEGKGIISFLTDEFKAAIEAANDPAAQAELEAWAATLQKEVAANG